MLVDAGCIHLLLGEIFCPHKLRFMEGLPPEVGSLELGSAEVSSLEVSSPEVGSLELGPKEVGPPGSWPRSRALAAYLVLATMHW